MHIVLSQKVQRALVLVSVSTMNNGSGCVYVCVCTAALCNIQICLTIYSVLVYSLVPLSLPWSDLAL